MNKTYYPTPPSLISKMLAKVKYAGDISYVLEPSAGDGAIIEAFKGRYCCGTVHAIEIDNKLRAILRGKKINVVGKDFLSFSGPDKYDLIIANPPFDKCDKHLLKAIDIMYSGMIVFLLNAETIKNPYSNTRKLLARKLQELGADIEYVNHGFIDAERKTSVEIALVTIIIKREIEQDLFDGMSQAEPKNPDEIKQDYEITQKNSIKNLVADYNRVVKTGTETLLNFYKNHQHIGRYLKISVRGNDSHEYRSQQSLTQAMKINLNNMVCEMRKSYWRRSIKLDQIKSRLTDKKRDEFNVFLQQNENLDFTEDNIKTFILNLINNYEDILTEAVLEIFDKMTIRHAYSKDLHNKNVHYFNGWKTNKAFKVNKKVILPFYNGFQDWGGWRLDYKVRYALDDIDTVMNYFDGKSEYVKISTAIEEAFKAGESKKIKSTYFTTTVFKKGTAHLIFNSEDILRRFNVTACKGCNMLPQDYGKKKYEQSGKETQDIIDSFEDKATYDLNVTPDKNLFRTKKNLFQLKNAAL
jgi:predicted RNA methylase